MSPVGVTPVAVVAHLMLDSVAWVDGRHQAVLVRPPRAPLTSRGCGATRKRWRPQGRIGDGLHGKGLIGDLRHHRALHRRQGQVLHRGVPGRLHLRGRPHALHPPRRVRGLRRLRARLPGGGHLLRRRRARPSGRTSPPPTPRSSPRARSRSAPRAERPTSAPWCATSPSSPTTRCLTASSPAHEHGRTVRLTTKASAAEARTAPGRVAPGRCRLGAGRSGRW